MQTHYPDRPLISGHGSRGKWAVNPDGKVFIFIHGYGGNAISTWSEFDLRLPTREACSKTDLVFYGYDGIRTNVTASASLFYSFLNSLFDNPAEIVNATVPHSAWRIPSFKYEELVIIAHSLGAVIARWALLFAHQSGSPWLSKTKMFLFAPAHKGASVLRLALSAFASFPLTVPITSTLQFFSPLTSELEPGSEVLRILEHETNVAIAGGISNLRPLRVFIAERETIVINVPFKGDPPPLAFESTNHFSVCKPRHHFNRPIDELLRPI